MIKYSIEELNQQFDKASPEEIIKWVLSKCKTPIVTTNFGPYSASLLHALSDEKPDIQVIWGDSGYNLNATYAYAVALRNQLDLNLKIYTPKFTRGYIDASLGNYMANEKGHQAFTDLVKIEPLKIAFQEHKPDVWFTNIRQDQTEFRKGLGIFSKSQSNILKVSPFYKYSKEALQSYLDKYDLPNELSYFDPTKIFENRECGLHLSSL